MKALILILIAIPFLLPLILTAITIRTSIRRNSSNQKEQQKRSRTLTTIALCTFAVLALAIVAVKITTYNKYPEYKPEKCEIDDQLVKSEYTELSLIADDPEYPVVCKAFEYEGTEYQFYGKTRGACAIVGVIAPDPVEALCPYGGALPTPYRVTVGGIAFFIAVPTAIIAYILLPIHKYQKDKKKKIKLENVMVTNCAIELAALLTYYVSMFV